MNEYDFGKLIHEQLEKEIESTISNAFSNCNSTSTTSTCAINSEPFTLEILKELQTQIKPYININKDLYELNYKPTVKLDYENDFSKQMYLYSYGMPILSPTKIITVKVQKRKHKTKRINKKWLKKYGYIEVKKEVPNYGFISMATC